MSNHQKHKQRSYKTALTTARNADAGILQGLRVFQQRPEYVLQDGHVKIGEGCYRIQWPPGPLPSLLRALCHSYTTMLSAAAGRCQTVVPGREEFQALLAMFRGFFFGMNSPKLASGLSQYNTYIYIYISRASIYI